MKKLLLLPLLVAILFLLPNPAFAVTLDDIISMSDADVSDEIIIALIRATDSVIRLSADDIVALEEAGVSDGVILFLIEGPENIDPGKSVDSDGLFLDRDSSIDNAISKSRTSPGRTPQYYESSNTAFDGGDISRPTYTNSSYSSGLTQTYYSTVYPGNSYSTQRYYQPYYYSGYPGYSSYPSYYIYGGKTYYGSNYYGGHYYQSYPSHYSYGSHYSSYSHHNRHHKSYSHSRGRYRHYGNDLHLSLGFSF